MTPACRWWVGACGTWNGLTVLVGTELCTDQYSAAMGAPTLSEADLLEIHRRMLLIRGFEERVGVLYRDGEVPGFVHLSVGQEASAVGACWPLRSDDVITSTHRGHGHCLAKGMDPGSMFAELMARRTGAATGAGVDRCT